MNKFKYAAIIAVVAISAVIGTTSMKKNSPKTELSGLALANVEALSQGENNCRNVNGFRTWNVNGNWFERLKGFYNCCYEYREGYSPKGNCM